MFDFLYFENINNNDNKEKNRVHRFLERSWYNIGNDESYDIVHI